ncbi:class I SAM-dependent methyltransferase [Knoellia locipacati]|uniref:methyltransferase domain-containing protein n=1 Tax=Knoellia locipacati TaxID=882824 RepID=UPI00384FE043
MSMQPTQTPSVTTRHTPAFEGFDDRNDVAEFEAHAGRGRFNSAFFWVMGGYINWHMRQAKATAFADLPSTVVELGSGVGANMRHLPVGARLIAIEPNPYMHTRLRRAARSRAIDLEIRSVVGERIDLPDASADVVISSLVLCSVTDPEAVLAEVRRVLRRGGRFSFAEHVAAKPGTPTRWVQRVLRRPWAWVFEGCSCERDLATLIESSGFSRVDLRHHRIHSPFLPFNTHISGTAIA